MRFACLLLLLLAPALGRAAPPGLLGEEGRVTPPPGAALVLNASLVRIAGSGWEAAQVLDAARGAGAILAACGVGLAATVHAATAPEHLMDFHPRASAALVTALGLPRPVAFFLRDTRADPPFDAEAVGRGNSATRPAMRYTVWLTRALAHGAVGLAHELMHVLMDSGEHDEEPGRLMNGETAPDNTAITADQCRRARETGLELGLLAPARKGPDA